MCVGRIPSGLFMQQQKYINNVEILCCVARGNNNKMNEQEPPVSKQTDLLSPVSTRRGRSSILLVQVVLFYKSLGTVVYRYTCVYIEYIHGSKQRAVTSCC